MKVSNPKLQKYFIILILLLLFPALFINPGLMPISGDEGTRALVSLEMEYSGNIITPTINGEFYFNKPPLYNWILLGFYKISNSHSEFIVRLPALLSLLLFGLTIFLLFYKKYGSRAAFLSAMVFITCGRILFYDSLNGYIDMTFSWLIFLDFIFIYRFFKREQYLALFTVSYLICTLAFLMKGIPALLFQGITILVIFISGGKFKKLFSLGHLAGILIFILITGSYYFIVFQQNPTANYISTLIDESAKRTFLEYGFLRTFYHLFTFPFEQLYHLFPWSLLLIVIFSGKIRKKIRQDQFLKYLGLVFIFNIPVYWISVESYPRYIFSLYPIILAICTIAFMNYREEIRRFTRFTEILIGISLALLIPLLLVFPWFYEFKTISHPMTIAMAGSVIILVMVFAYYFLSSYRLEITIVTLLLFRIGFNLIALPERYAESRSVTQKAQAETVGKLTRGSELFLADFAPCSHETCFYISRQKGEILRRDFNPPKSGYYYIIDGTNKVKDNEDNIYNFETRWRNSALRLSGIK